MARQVGLVKGERVAMEGLKFRAVSSAQAVREREAVKLLGQLENADQQDEVMIDERAVAAAREKLKSNPEAGSAVHAYGEWACTRIQRADRRRCRTHDHWARGAGGEWSSSQQNFGR